MSNEKDVKDPKEEKAKSTETILVLVVALVIFYWFTKQPYLLLAAVILGAIGIFIPFLAGKIHWAWMKLAHVMGYVMSKVILTIVFFVFMYPLSLLSKIFRKTSSVQLKAGGKSYFKERNFTYTKESLENVW